MLKAIKIRILNPHPLKHQRGWWNQYFFTPRKTQVVIFWAKSSYFLILHTLHSKYNFIQKNEHDMKIMRHLIYAH